MRRAAVAALPPMQTDPFIPNGGMDEITPPLQLSPGACPAMSNFEQGVRGGYQRIQGYERWGGNIPMERLTFQKMALASNSGGTQTLYAGELIEGTTSGARAIVAGRLVPVVDSPGTQTVPILTTPTTIYVAGVSGVFAAAETIRTIQPSGTTAMSIAVSTPPFDLAGATPAEYAQSVQDAEDSMREALRPHYEPLFFNDITVVGIGAIDRTVYVFFLSTYPPDGTRALRVWKPATVDPTLPKTLVNWQWTQAAYVTLDGSSQIFPTEPAYIDLVEYNFAGATSAKKLYGVSGVGKAFSFDGTTFVALTTGMATDAPTRLAVHKNRLFLAFGASLQFSTAGDPTSWTPVLGAGEISMGESVTAMGTALGSDASSALLIGTDRGCAVLYGDTSSDFRLVWVSRDMGMRANSLQFMAMPLFLNDYGVTSLAASQAFGNFDMALLSQSVQRFIRPRLQRVTCSLLVRGKNQYRVFFDDGTGLYFTFSGTKLAAITPVRFDRVVRHVVSTLDYNGDELIVFASDDRFVYRMDSGRNFDGRPIDAYLFLSLNHMQSPRVRKSFKRAALEIDAESGYVAFEAGGTVDHGGPDTLQSPETALQNQQGTLWDELTWDEFVWDTGGRQPTVLPLDGTGKNVSIWLRCTSELVAPFALTGVITHYLVRRLER